MMKHLFAMALALGLAVAGVGRAQAATTPVPATGIVETPHAVFFQPAAFPNVVWYFTKSELKLTVVDPVTPAGTFWRAAIVLQHVTADDLAALPAAWAGKSMVPYIVRPTTECVLNRLPEMRFVVQELKAQNHDITPANPTSVCRFTYRLPTVQPADLQERLAALVASDTLVTRDLHLDVSVAARIPWATVHGAVAAALAGGAGEGEADGGPAALTRAEAEGAVDLALASLELRDVASSLTDAERDAFVAAAVAALFTADLSGTEYHLVTAAPTGTVVYHQELFSRAM
jgi:hypothetical protein